MKRFVTVIAAMVLAATVLMGADNSGKYLTKSFDFKNFSGIEAGGLVNVNVVKSDVYKVNLKVPDILEPYLRVKVQGDELKIGLENVPSKISRKIGDMHGGQTGAVVKCFKINVCKAWGDGDAGQTFAVMEGIETDASGSFFNHQLASRLVAFITEKQGT